MDRFSEATDGNPVLELKQRGTGTILRLSNGGGTVYEVDSLGNVVSTAAYFSAGDGLVATPGYRFTNEPTSGLFRASAGNIAVTILGVQTTTFAATSLLFSAGASFAIGTSDAQSLTVQTNGTTRMTVTSAGAFTWTGVQTTGIGFSWTNSTLTSGQMMNATLSGTSVVATSANTGSIASFVSTTTGFTGATQRLVKIDSTGTNTNASVVLHGLSVSLANTGTTSTNACLSLSATGASTNVAISIVAGDIIHTDAIATGTAFLGTYNSLTTGKGINILANALTTGQMMNLTLSGASAVAPAASTGSIASFVSTSTGFAAQTSALVAIVSSGANATTSAIVQGLNVTITNTGTTGTNTGIAVALSGTGATQNGTTISVTGSGTTNTSLTITTSGAGTNIAISIVSGTINPADGVNVVLGTSTGTKIGTATTQKLGFYNVTPVVQPPASADVTGFAAGGGTASKSDSTWNGASGASAYTVGGLVTALKALGLIAA